MPDWGKLFGALLEGAAGFAAGAKIGEWLGMSEEEAFASIVEFVEKYPQESIDFMDEALLQQAVYQVQPETRLRLVKLYTIFKIAEFAQYGRFRGFPSL